MCEGLVIFLVVVAVYWIGVLLVGVALGVPRLRGVEQMIQSNADPHAACANPECRHNRLYHGADGCREEWRNDPMDSYLHGSWSRCPCTKFQEAKG